jgi:hypothetical protein
MARSRPDELARQVQDIVDRLRSAGSVREADEP